MDEYGFSTGMTSDTAPTLAKTPRQFGRRKLKDESLVPPLRLTTIMPAAKPLHQCMLGGAIAQGTAIRYFLKER